jgi:hypothetical protein
MEFQDFPKMARLTREIIITEKIDGTNAQVAIVELEGHEAPGAIYQSGGLALYAGSRTRWITPEDDNYGFAKWAQENGEELLKLGPGRHFGEWWGCGIQRRYGIEDKRFSLFNVSRWEDDAVRPACCLVVPTLYRGDFTGDAAESALGELRDNGSLAAPGFMKPEGIVLYHIAAGVGFKKTLEKDEVPKSVADRKAA